MPLRRELADPKKCPPEWIPFYLYLVSLKKVLRHSKDAVRGDDMREGPGGFFFFLRRWSNHKLRDSRL